MAKVVGSEVSLPLRVIGGSVCRLVGAESFVPPLSELNMTDLDYTCDWLRCRQLVERDSMATRVTARLLRRGQDRLPERP